MKKNKNFFYSILLFFLLPFSINAQAEKDDTTLSTSKKESSLTFKNLINNPQANGPIEITGVILRRLSDNIYLIQDHTAVLKIFIPSQLSPKDGFLPHSIIKIQGDVNSQSDNDKLNIKRLKFSF